MKQWNAAHMVCLLVGSVILAGCTGDLGDSGIGSKADFPRYSGNYTWPAPIIHDGNGNVFTDHPLKTDPNVPTYVYQLIPGAGPEPTVGVTSKDTVFVVTLDQVRRTTDYGRTWQVVYDYSSFNSPTTHDVYTTMDPLLYVDPDTDYIFVSHLEPDPAGGALVGPWCQYLAYSKDDGKTWSDKGDSGRPGVQGCMIGVADHQKLGSAKLGPKTSPTTRTAFENYPNKYSKVLYYCHQKFDLIGDPTVIYQNIITIPQVNPRSNPLLGTWCETSYDAGATWNTPVQLSPLRPNCPAGIQGMPAAHPDGTVMVALGGFGEKCLLPPEVYVTEDSGVTWQKRVMPNQTIGQVEIDPDITVTPDGTAYMAFRGLDQHLYMVRSKDKFQTWSQPYRVSPPDHTMNVFTGITSGDDGRIAIHYLGTRDAQERSATPSNATGGTLWYSFITWTHEADAEDPVFHTIQTTPLEDPIQIGCVWLSGGGGGPNRCRNLLDFIDATRDRHGRVIAVTTDGCTPRSDCTADIYTAQYQSHDREAALLVQDFGYSLFKEEGVLPRLGLENPRPLPPT